MKKSKGSETELPMAKVEPPAPPVPERKHLSGIRGFAVACLQCQSSNVFLVHDQNGTAFVCDNCKDTLAL